MLSRLTLCSLLMLLSAILVAPKAIAQEEGSNDTRVEKYQDLTETEMEDEVEVDVSEEELEPDAAAEESEAEAPTTRVDEYLQEVPAEE